MARRLMAEFGLLLLLIPVAWACLMTWVELSRDARGGTYRLLFWTGVVLTLGSAFIALIGVGWALVAVFYGW